MTFCQAEERALQAAQARADLGALRFYVEPKIEARPGRCGSGPSWDCAGGADAFCQLRFDIMDVFQGAFPTKIPGFDFRFDHRQGRLDLLVLFLCQDAGASERGSVRKRAFDVVRVEPPVDRDRLAVELRRFVRWFVKSSLSHVVNGSNARASR